MSGRSIVIATAGHIDHGKSALVRALTGIDPDRLKEERGGITIDLGFAHVEAGDTTLSFVDVPGHERFVKNIDAGWRRRHRPRDAGGGGGRVSDALNA